MSDIVQPKPIPSNNPLDGLFGPSTVFGNPVASLLVSGLMASDSSVSGAGSAGRAMLDTSGQVVGSGSATGGNLSSSDSGQALPWYVWAAGALACIAIIKKAA